MPNWEEVFKPRPMAEQENQPARLGDLIKRAAEIIGVKPSDTCRCEARRNSLNRIHLPRF